MNKKLTILLVLVVATLGIIISSVAFAARPDSGPGEDVRICHFLGHNGDFELPAIGLGCDFLGGQALAISAAAACNGHGVLDACPR